MLYDIDTELWKEYETDVLVPNKCIATLNLTCDVIDDGTPRPREQFIFRCLMHRDKEYTDRTAMIWSRVLDAKLEGDHLKYRGPFLGMHTASIYLPLAPDAWAASRDSLRAMAAKLMEDVPDCQAHECHTPHFHRICIYDTTQHTEVKCSVATVLRNLRRGGNSAVGAKRARR